MLNQLLDGGLLLGLLLPLFGTTLGAGCVFFLKHQIHPLVQKALLGFASGVMVAAAVWSLLIPAMDQSAHLGGWPSCRRRWAFCWAWPFCC